MSRLVLMNALLVGTVVGPQVNSAGEPVGDQIIHVDPNNDAENGRYSRPVVTEEVAQLLEKNGFAERAKGRADSRVAPRDVRSELEAEIDAGLEDRLAEVIDADNEHLQPSALSSRQLVNFQNGDQIRGGAGPAPGTPTFDDDGDDAPAAPAARISPKLAGATAAKAPAAPKPKAAPKRAPARSAAAAPKPAETPPVVES
jgi:hypothetical protein